MSKINTTEHIENIPKYVDLVKSYTEKRFKVIRSQGIEEEILNKYFIEGWRATDISAKYNISVGTISSFVQDYLLSNYEDSQVEQAAIIDSENHLGIMTSFFSNVFFLSREASLNAMFARKLREEIAMHIAENGAIETAKNRDLMMAWDRVTDKTVRYGDSAIKQMDTYVKLMTEVLDKQKDIAFVKVLFDTLQKLEPKIVEKLQKALAEDEYARAVLESLSGEMILKTFKARKEGKLYVDSAAEVIDAAFVEE